MTNSEYILLHRNDDVRDLALKPCPDGVDLRRALVQISGWQKAMQKLPSWTQNDGIIFPEHLSMEQCSSERTAEYKLSVVSRLCAGGRMVDLTAGFGVDATVMGRHFRHVTLVERNPELCDILRNNLPLLNVKDYEIVNDDCVEWVENYNVATCGRFDMLFLDPARRDVNGRKTVLIGDCTPDVCQLQTRLKAMAKVVVVKLSPLLDLTSVERELTGLAELHVVSVENECKEVIAVMKGDAEGGSPEIICVNLTKKGIEQFVFTRDEERGARVDFFAADDAVGTPLYLYEPNASVLKAGAYRTVASRYGVQKAETSSHLYFSADFIEDFPGRAFRVIDIVQPNKAGIKQLKQLKKANITTRNYPMSVSELRQKLQLRDGGDKYLFATTLTDARRVVAVCEKRL